MLETLIQPRFVVALILGLYFLFGLTGIGKYVTTDEHFWFYERIPEYWEAVKERDWKKTAVNDKPGISVVLVGGPGLLLADPTTHRDRDTERTLNNFYTLYNAEMSEHLFSVFRIPFLIVNGLLLVLLFFAWRHFLGERGPAFIATSLTALSPILLGITRIVNPDALLWSTSIVSVATFLVWLQTNRTRWLLISSAALALALLSKYTANALIPLLFGAALIYPFFVRTFPGSETFATYSKRISSGFLLLLGGSLSLYALALPESLHDPRVLWEGTLGFLHQYHILQPLLGAVLLLYCASLLKPQWLESFFAFLDTRHFSRPLMVVVLPFLALFFVLTFLLGLGSQSLFPIHALYSSAKEGGELVFRFPEFIPHIFEPIGALLVGLYPITFSVTPVVLIGAFFAWILAWHERLSPRESFIILLFTGFSLVFVTMNLVSGVLPNARYSIVLFPLFTAIAAIGWWRGYEAYFEWIKKPHLGAKYSPLLPLALIALSFIILIRTFPFPFNYASPLLSREFALHDGWGYGQYEAAQYLNTLPNADSLVVWSDRNGLCAFLRGPKCLTGYRIDTERAYPNYFILSKRGAERNYIARNKKTEVPLFEYATALPRSVWRLDILGRPGNYMVVVPAR